MEGIKILTWNCRGIFNKKHEFTNHINDFDIIVLTEIKKYKRNNSIYFSGYKTISEQNQDNCGGIAIIVRNNLELEVIKDIDNSNGKIEVAGIKIMNTDIRFKLIALYKKPNTPINTIQWNKIIEKSSEGLNTIITGDFNSHNIMWNYHNTDKAGEILFEAMNNNGLICLNMDTRSREGYIGQKSSNIDLFFGTPSMADITECTQIDDTWGPDHYPIVCSVETSREIYCKRTNRITTQKTEWKRYMGSIENIIKEKGEEEIKKLTNEEYPLNDRYKGFTDIIRETIDKITRTKCWRKKKNGQKDDTKLNQPKKCWDIDCQEAIDNRKKALKSV